MGFSNKFPLANFGCILVQGAFPFENRFPLATKKKWDLYCKFVTVTKSWWRLNHGLENFYRLIKIGQFRTTQHAVLALAYFFSMKTYGGGPNILVTRLFQRKHSYLLGWKFASLNLLEIRMSMELLYLTSITWHGYCIKSIDIEQV